MRSTHKQLLLFCRALLQSQRLDESPTVEQPPTYDDVEAMQLTIRTVALVLQLAQMGRSVDWWFAVCGQVHILDSDSSEGEPLLDA